MSKEKNTKSYREGVLNQKNKKSTQGYPCFMKIFLLVMDLWGSEGIKTFFFFFVQIVKI
jgi:hypothetical protein